MRELLLATVLLSTVSSEDFKTVKRYSSVSEGNPEFWPVRGRRTFWNAFRPSFNDRPLDKGREYRRILEPFFFLRDPAQAASLIAFIRYLKRVEPWPNDVDEFANSGRHEITNRKRKPSSRRISYEFNELTGDSEHHKYSSSGRDRRESQDWKRQEPLYVEEPRWIKIDTLDRMTKEDRPIFITSQGKKVCRFKETKEVIDRFDDYYPDSFFSVRGRRNFALTKLKKFLGDKNILKYLIEKERGSKMDTRHDNRIEDGAFELNMMKNEGRKESNGLENIEDPFISLRSERSVEKNVVRNWENVAKDPERSIASKKSNEVADDSFAKMTMSNGSKNDEEQAGIRRQKRSVRNDEKEKSNTPRSATNNFEKDEVNDEENDDKEEARKEEGNFETGKRTDRRASRTNRCEIPKKHRTEKTIDHLKRSIGKNLQTPLMLILRKKRSNLVYEDETKIREEPKNVKKCSRLRNDDRRKEAVQSGERSIVEEESFGYVHPRNKHFSIMNVHDDEPFFISRGKKSLTDLHSANVDVLENEIPEENDRYLSGSRDLLINRRETSTGLEAKLKYEGSSKFWKNSAKYNDIGRTNGKGKLFRDRPRMLN